MSVAELKAKGNAEFAAKRYEAAIQHYSDAIAAASGEADAPHVLYSNRSACYSGLKDYTKALEDAEKVCCKKKRRLSVPPVSSADQSLCTLLTDH